MLFLAVWLFGDIANLSGMYEKQGDLPTFQRALAISVRLFVAAEFERGPHS